jgi:hypothetical protein
MFVKEVLRSLAIWPRALCDKPLLIASMSFACTCVALDASGSYYW